MSNSVSIIIPTYNSSKYIARTINSILLQTFCNWEIIVVDDGSNDNTIDIIQEFINKGCRINLVRLEKNSGAAIARNTALEMAKSRYIAFLDADDVWLPNKLERQIDFMRKKKVDFSYTAYRKVDERGHVIGTVGVPEKLSYTDLLKKCEIGCLTAIYDTKNLGKIFMPNIRKRQDLGLWLRILKKIPYAYGLNIPLAEYTLRSDSISANKRKAALYTWTLYREVEHLPFFLSVYYFLHYAVNGLLRTKLPHIAKFIGVLK